MEEEEEQELVLLLQQVPILLHGLRVVPIFLHQMVMDMVLITQTDYGLLVVILVEAETLWQLQQMG
jgi:hypothetical protein